MNKPNENLPDLETSGYGCVEDKNDEHNVGVILLIVAGGTIITVAILIWMQFR